jgi:hypothetical protein
MSGLRDTKFVVGIWMRVLGVLCASLQMLFNSWMRILLVFYHVGIELLKDQGNNVTGSS